MIIVQIPMSIILLNVFAAMLRNIRKTSNLFLDSAIRCEHASKATANLLKESVRNNIFQTRKVQILSQKHIRERLMLYFNGLRDNSTDKNKHIHIPFNRQELADYLGVERSALCREMGRMKDEGIIDYNKQDIILNCDLLKQGCRDGQAVADM